MTYYCHTRAASPIPYCQSRLGHSHRDQDCISTETSIVRRRGRSDVTHVSSVSLTRVAGAGVRRGETDSDASRLEHALQHHLPTSSDNRRYYTRVPQNHSDGRLVLPVTAGHHTSMRPCGLHHCPWLSSMYDKAEHVRTPSNVASRISIGPNRTEARVRNSSLRNASFTRTVCA